MAEGHGDNLKGEVFLREIREDDLETFFEQMRDPEANTMAAFTAEDPADNLGLVRHGAVVGLAKPGGCRRVPRKILTGSVARSERTLR